MCTLRFLVLLSQYLFQLGLFFLIQVMLANVHKVVHIMGCAVAEEVCKVFLLLKKKKNKRQNA